MTTTKEKPKSKRGSTSDPILHVLDRSKSKPTALCGEKLKGIRTEKPANCVVCLDLAE